MTANGPDPTADTVPPVGSGYVLPSDVAFVPLADGSGRLLDLNGNFYALPPVASALLGEVLKAGEAGPDRAVARISSERVTDPEIVRRDLDAFLAHLLTKGLLQRSASPTASPRPSRLFALALRAALAVSRAPAVRCWVLLALAYLAVRRLGWPRTVATWASVAARRALSHPDGVQEIERAVRAATAWHPLQVACKERSLTCWILLRTAGLPAEIVVGADFYPFASHCWCRLNGTVFADFADRCERYRPVFVYA